MPANPGSPAELLALQRDFRELARDAASGQMARNGLLARGRALLARLERPDWDELSGMGRRPHRMLLGNVRSLLKAIKERAVTPPGAALRSAELTRNMACSMQGYQLKFDPTSGAGRLMRQCGSQNHPVLGRALRYPHRHQINRNRK